MGTLTAVLTWTVLAAAPVQPATQPATKAVTQPATKTVIKTVSKSPQLALLPIEMNIIERTNAERARYGLAPLTIDGSLMNTARQQAIWMVNSRNLQHTHLMVAENIAMGQTSSTQAVNDWMNSPGHRSNILNGGYTRIGAAAYTTPDGTIYWCQQFLR